MSDITNRMAFDEAMAVAARQREEQLKLLREIRDLLREIADNTPNILDQE